MPDKLQPENHVEVARGLGEPACAHLVEDPYTGVRAEHLQPLGPSGAAVIPDGPSVWEATGDEDE